MGQEVYYKWDYFYPRPPRGGRLPRTGLVVIVNEISTHALREEGDCPGAAA